MSNRAKPADFLNEDERSLLTFLGAMKMRNKPGRCSASGSGRASKPGTARRQRLSRSDSVITEMSAGLKDTSRGPEGGVEERERGREEGKGGQHLVVCFFHSTTLQCQQCQPVLPLQLFFITVTHLSPAALTQLHCKHGRNELFCTAKLHKSPEKRAAAPNTHGCLHLAVTQQLLR